MAISNNGFGNNGYGDMLSDLHAQEAASLQKRIQPSSPEDFIKWVRETLREHRQKYDALSEEHKKLSRAGELATVGLTRLGSLIRFGDRMQYEHLLELHRNFMFENQNIGYALQGCKDVIDETTMNMQFVAETLKSALADRHKKIAAEKELGLRLRDLDQEFDRCQRAVNQQNKLFRQLSEGIQTLMSKAKLKLPAKVKEKIDREDQVAKLAVMHKKSLEKGKDVINPEKYVPPKTINKVKIKSDMGKSDLGDESSSNEDTSKTDSNTDKVDPKIAVAVTTIGLILGILIFHVLMPR